LGNLETCASNPNNTEYCKINPTGLSLKAMAKDDDDSKDKDRNIDADLCYGDAFLGGDHFRQSREVERLKNRRRIAKIDKTLPILRCRIAKTLMLVSVGNKRAGISRRPDIL
jgi:hypothetical protein